MKGRGLRNRNVVPSMFENAINQFQNLALSMDYDWDGVPNQKDCRPFNPFLQHIHKQKSLTSGKITQSKFITGYGDPELMGIKKEKPKLKQIRGQSKILRFLEELDSDQDGVPDVKDCEPHNPKKQHIRPSRTMRDRLERLPIFVAHQRVYKPMPSEELEAFKAEQPFHIMQKEAMKRYPEETIAALSAIKKYPGIVGQMEKLKGLGTMYYFVGEPDPRGDRYGSTEIRGTIAAPTRQVYVMYPPHLEDEVRSAYIADIVEYITKNFPEEEWKTHFDRIPHSLERIIFKGDPEIERKKKKRLTFASTAFHELKHVEQSKDIGEYEQKVRLESSLPWVKREVEQEAVEFSREKLEEHLKNGRITPEMYEQILGLE